MLRITGRISRLQQQRKREKRIKCETKDEPGIDYAAFVGAAMFLATRSHPDNAFSLSGLRRFQKVCIRPKSSSCPAGQAYAPVLAQYYPLGVVLPFPKAHSRSFSEDSRTHVALHMIGAGGLRSLWRGKQEKHVWMLVLLLGGMLLSGGMLQ
jgi:hypothetical protein